MAAPNSPRHGSLQFWPRKRASKFLPSVNWKAISDKNSEVKLKGFIGYKVGMKSAIVKDNTPDSMTKGKKIARPVTIIECPPMKIFSVRLYKNGIVAKEIINDNLEKELKRVVKLPAVKHKIDEIKHEDYDDIRVIVYSLVKRTGIKKTPDMIELALSGSVADKMKFVKENMHKEISVSDIFTNEQLVDVRGLTIGKGLVGPVKRFGITLKQHKSEKGVRRPGSLGPWHPARVTYYAPQAGQLGMFTRIVYNNKIVLMSKDVSQLKGIENFGDVKTDYIVLNGSIQGPGKRQLLVTMPIRPSMKQSKKKWEFLELV